MKHLKIITTITLLVLSALTILVTFNIFGFRELIGANESTSALIISLCAALGLGEIKTTLFKNKFVLYSFITIFVLLIVAGIALLYIEISLIETSLLLLSAILMIVVTMRRIGSDSRGRKAHIPEVSQETSN